jgi:hypothetical protein
MALVASRDLVGLEAYSADEVRIGTVKDVISDEGSDCEYLVIGRRFGRGIVVPLDAVHMPEGRVVVPRASSFLDMAPTIKKKGSPTLEECERLRQFYRVS